MAQPQFDAHEVLQAIEMEKSTTFVVVEGSEVDVFDNAIRGLLNQKGYDTNWVVVSGSDKDVILNFFKKTKSKNAFAILDHDFTGEVAVVERVGYLDRYSIENYLLDEMVIRQTNARLYRKSSSKIDLGTNKLISYYRESFRKLLVVLRAYQTASHNRSVAWSDKNLLIKDCWKVNEQELQNLLDEIGQDFPCALKVSSADCDDVLIQFPAKLLVRGVYQFVRKDVKPPGFTKVFNNEKAFMHALFGNIEYSHDFMQCLSIVREFLVQREALQ